jgi:hypothetical protein
MRAAGTIVLRERKAYAAIGAGDYDGRCLHESQIHICDMRDNSTSKRALLRTQRRWATAHGLYPDARGYLDKVDDNLRQALSARALAAFEAGGGAELNDRPGLPAKMKALHSSAALVVNVFDYWSECDRDGDGNGEFAARPLCEALTQALDLDAELRLPLRFEAQLPTGLPGNPPNLDVLLELTNGVSVGIESKFTEWLTAKRTNRPPFRPKYFEQGAKPWTRSGMPHCQALVRDMLSGSERFRTLDAAQLLKHALGLAAHNPGRFSLIYLYFDWPCPAAEAHRYELARFGERIGAEIGFRALTYQDFFGRLARSCAVDAGYLEYLEARYFFGRGPVSGIIGP